MRKIQNFEEFAAGYFTAIGVKRPTADDIYKHCIQSRPFAAALSFYMFTNTYVIAKETMQQKYEAVAKNIRQLIGD